MSLFRCALPTVALILCLTLRARADEIIVDGKPCNSSCQSWLGINATPDDHASAPISPTRPALRQSATKPVVVKRRPSGPLISRLGAGQQPLSQRANLELPFDVHPPPHSIPQGQATRRRSVSSFPISVPRASRVPEVEMTAGVKGLPKLSEIVAVHGTIIIESAEDRADVEKIRTRLLRSTSRPRQKTENPVVDDLVSPSASSVPKGTE